MGRESWQTSKNRTFFIYFTAQHRLHGIDWWSDSWSVNETVVVYLRHYTVVTWSDWGKPLNTWQDSGFRVEIRYRYVPNTTQSATVWSHRSVCVYSTTLSTTEDTELQERQNVKGEGAWPVGQYRCDIHPTGTGDIQEENCVDAQFFRTYSDPVPAFCWLGSFTLP